MMFNGANCYGQDYHYLMNQLASKGYLAVVTTEQHPSDKDLPGKAFHAFLHLPADSCIQNILYLSKLPTQDLPLLVDAKLLKKMDEKHSMQDVSQVATNCSVWYYATTRSMALCKTVHVQKADKYGHPNAHQPILAAYCLGTRQRVC